MTIDWMKYYLLEQAYLLVSIVVVPGEGASIPDSWDNGTGSWLYHMVAAALPRAQIWAYHYNINVTGGTVIQQIFDEGFALLECLTRLPRRNVSLAISLIIKLNLRLPPIECIVSHSVFGSQFGRLDPQEGRTISLCENESLITQSSVRLCVLLVNAISSSEISLM